ncbi:hypothetical protein JW890_00025 [candidate division WOR-3 bacterium]|nr:hypothetical protein [candidate division WOR-3 bacterium]
MDFNLIGRNPAEKYTSAYFIPDKDYLSGFYLFRNYIKTPMYNSMSRSDIKGILVFTGDLGEIRDVQEISKFLNRGGKAVFLLNTSAENLAYLSSEFNIQGLSLAQVEENENPFFSTSLFVPDVIKNDTVWLTENENIEFRTRASARYFYPILTSGGLSLVKNSAVKTVSFPLYYEIPCGKGRFILFSNPHMFSTKRILRNVPQMFYALDNIESEGKNGRIMLGGFMSLFMLFLCSVRHFGRKKIFLAAALLLYLKLFSVFSCFRLNGTGMTVGVFTLWEKEKREVSLELSRSGAAVLSEAEDFLFFLSKRICVSKQYRQNEFINMAFSGDLFFFDEKKIPGKASWAKIIRMCEPEIEMEEK